MSGTTNTNVPAGNDQYRSDLNTGLSTSFQLTSTGAFGLIGGPVKCQDNIMMLLAFGGWFRFYYEDFCVNLWWMIEKPSSFIQTFKTLVLGQFVIAAQKYAGFISIQKSNIFYNPVNRKELTIGIEYTYTLQPNSKQQYVQVLNP